MTEARRIIAAKRDGKVLSSSDLAWMARGLADGTVTDAQAGAFAMAVLLNGMEVDERVALTLAMRDSGSVLEWDLPGPVVDKHSTGGVGDNVSLILAPALAVCGAYVPMISGRGLGHTGGTLDKLEAIPGYRTDIPRDELASITGDLGCAIVGATADIAPADRRLYGVRDVTATVESIDLITGSILSKKLAAGLEGLILDVKCGSGAFMVSPRKAAELARALVSVANGAGCRTAALVSDMNEPLASAAGNALEVANALDLLTLAEVDARLWDLTVTLGGTLLELSGLADSRAGGEAMLSRALQSGRAAERFGAMVRALGGPADLVEHYRDHLPAAPVVREIPSPRTGFLSKMDTTALGLAVVDLGGGRHRQGDKLDLSVGLDRLAGLGIRVAAGDPLGRVHAATDAAAERAVAAVQAACTLADTPPEEAPLVLDRIA